MLSPSSNIHFLGFKSLNLSVSKEASLGRACAIIILQFGKQSLIFLNPSF
jgi:hypothetical protein